MMPKDHPTTHTRAEALRRHELREARKADRSSEGLNPACVKCGETRGVEWHHIYGRANSDDGQWLCRPCHQAVSSSQYNMPADVLSHRQKTPQEKATAKLSHVVNDLEQVYLELGRLLDRFYDIRDELS